MKILSKPEDVSLLREAFKYVMEKHPFKIDAIVILPDHLHCIWSLPKGDEDYLTRWRSRVGCAHQFLDQKPIT